MQEHNRQKNKKLIALELFSIFILIPCTIGAGIYLWNDRRYYPVSLLILFFSIVPYIMAFEARKPQARELIVTAVLSGIAVAGRAAFFMLPQIKPVAAIVIITGVAFGAESGFLVGVMSAFVSNFFFGQGPWTPWQMFCFGSIGFLSGILFQKGRLPKNKIVLCIFGFLAVFFLYGGVINLGSVLMWSSRPSAAQLLASYSSGLPFDLAHAAATVLFLWVLTEPMLEKLDRIKQKYGLMEPVD